MFGWNPEYRKWLHPDDIFDEIIDRVEIVDLDNPNNDTHLYEVTSKDDEHFIYSLCEAMAAGINARHPEWASNR